MFFHNSLFMEISQQLILIVISHMVAYLSRWHQKQCKDLHVFDNLESGNCFRKACKKSGILGPKVCTNPVFTVDSRVQFIIIMIILVYLFTLVHFLYNIPTNKCMHVNWSKKTLLNTFIKISYSNPKIPHLFQLTLKLAFYCSVVI